MAAVARVVIKGELYGRPTEEQWFVRAMSDGTVTCEVRIRHDTECGTGRTIHTDKDVALADAPEEVLEEAHGELREAAGRLDQRLSG
jgi:hypothetical protein